MSSIPTRQEFLFFTANWQHYFFYAMTYVVLAAMAYQFWLKAKFWLKGRAMGQKFHFTFPGLYAQGLVWFRQVWVYILAQKKVRSSRPRSGAPMHLLMFYGFCACTLATTILAINTYGPFKFYYGAFFEGYKLTFDVCGLFFITGILWAIGRRFYTIRAQKRVVLSHIWSDYWALCLLLILVVTGYWLEASRISATPWHDWNWFSPVATTISLAQGHFSPAMYRFVWWFHICWVWIFFLTLPQMKIKHIVMAILTSAGAPKVPMGRLEPISMESVEETGKIGASEPADFDRWHLMSLDACMECGRCTEVCPAWKAGKKLNPKLIVQESRSALYDGVSLAEKVTDEELWACTTCNACVEACPVLIRQVDLIVDMRRNLVAEGKVSGSVATMLRQTASTKSAWGSATDREAWMDGHNVPLARDKKAFDILFWVGCAGATDPAGIKTSQAIAFLLNKAGVDFACLGTEESCTGDPARRAGDEFQFQELATGNQATLQKYQFNTIITACPHCFNTFANEYADFGSQLKVEHHTQVLARLIKEGKLKSIQTQVTYHDPCYLARVNQESVAPRSLLQLPVLEPEHRGEKTLCCGAGGGRMWMEEEPGQRPAENRMKELLDTGAETVALGCPFCKIMLETGVPAEKAEKVRLVDLAVLMQESNLDPS